MKPITKREHAIENGYKAIRSLGFQIINTTTINKGRYRIIQTETQPLLMIYKTEVLMTFNRISKENTVGETINKEDLWIAYNKGCRHIVRVSPSGCVNIASIKEFIDKGREWQVEEGKVVISSPISVFKNIGG